VTQFCTYCGKPLSPGVRFCPSCGGAVASPMPPAASATSSSATPSQFTPMTGSVPRDPVAPPASEDKWTTVRAPVAPEISQPLQSSQFAPVDVPAAPQPTSSPSPSQGWANVAPVDVAASNGKTNSSTSAQEASFSPVSFPATPPASTPNQQWSQTPTNAIPPSVPLSAGGQPPQRRSVLPKLIGIALVLILLVGVAVVGGVVYVGYKVRQKARAVSQTFSHLADDKNLDLAKGGSPDAKGALQGLLNALSGKTASADGIPILSSNDPVTPCDAFSFPAQDKARVPFKAGTVFTTAWGVKYGDVEARNSVDSIDDSTVRTTSATQEYKNDNGTMSKAVTVTNQNCNSDYQSASGYMTVNATKMPSLMHDVTRFRLSDKAFQEIKSSGQTNLQYVDIWAAANGVKLTHQGGVLTRVEPQDVKYPMIVNDQRVDLPVIHLTGSMSVLGKDPRPANLRPVQSGGEFFILDDPANPLVLNWRLKDPLYHNGNFRVEIIKINFPVAKPENVLEKQLTEEKRAVTYGIYFDFNKDTLKPESEPVMKEIVQAMTDNPDWKLTVEGHTDNIGGDPYNLDLSKRRAAAVKQALVSQYDIAPGRLLTGGFGASRPIEANDTLEGRARNRRVELVRQ
jgi:outer membrane protein OmpA-like peptidoglycan-associated protein